MGEASVFWVMKVISSHAAPAPARGWARCLPPTRKIAPWAAVARVFSNVDARYVPLKLSLVGCVAQG